MRKKTTGAKAIYFETHIPKIFQLAKIYCFGQKNHDIHLHLSFQNISVFYEFL